MYLTWAFYALLPIADLLILVGNSTQQVVMMSDLDQVKQHADALYELLRDNADSNVKAHLRKLLYQLEMMDGTATVAPHTRCLSTWLAQLCDVEHGMLVKHYPDEPNEMDEINIDRHVKGQQEQLRTGMVLQSKVAQGVKHLAGMLGASGLHEVAVHDQIAWFANVLLEHLREDRDMGNTLHELALATMESLRAVQTMLVGIGEESPELQHVAMMLSRPIPDDPVEAREYLKTVNTDLQHVQRKMIEGGKQMQHDIDGRVQAFEEVSSQLSSVQKQARSDVLTGLPNRRALTDFLTEHAQQAVMSLAIMDIDHLQQVNDLAGEAGGNRCLCEIADLLIGRLRNDDMVFRVGGDEFVAVFPAVGGQAAVQAVQSLYDSIDSMPPLSFAGGTIKVRVSFGLAERAANESLHDWIKRADAALYVAKSKGGGSLEVSP
jgi:diguanylate cyclase (GGDEF)-like protein